MQPASLKSIAKATFVPLEYLDWNFKLDHEIQITKAINIQPVSGVFGSEKFELWKDYLPQNELNTYISAQYAIRHSFQSNSEIGFLENESLRLLLQIPIAGQVVRLTADGKLAHLGRYTSELVLGEQFIGMKYRSSVVHIIVRNKEGDESAGTGFFVIEPENHIVTAGHLFEGRRLIRVEDIGGNILADEAAEIRIAPGRLDLAVIRCEKPAAVTPFRIEWRDDAIKELDGILVFGYPPFAGHGVALASASGQVIAFAPITGEPGKHSIIISRIAAPGCSGGPAVNKAGFVVGVLSKDNIVERAHPPQVITYISATPARYLQDLIAVGQP